MSGQTLMTLGPNPRVCILRLSALGDVCHAVAAVQQLQRHRPDATITWIVGRVEYGLLEGLPGVELVVFDKRQGLRGLLDLRRRLSKRRFDVLLHMQVALRASLASLCVRARRRVGFDRSRAKEGQWLFARDSIASQQHPHVLEGFQAFVQYLGVPVAKPLWSMPIPEEARDWAKTQRDIWGGFAIISPAASKAERNWAADRYAKVAECLADRGLRVVLCGGPAALDRALADEIQASAQCDCVDLVGKTPLKSLIALIEAAELVLAPDTGPLHMAITVGTPVVGLYAHSNPRRTGPYAALDTVVSVYDEVIAEQKGRGWTDLAWGVRAKGENLMERIQVEPVLHAVERALNNVKHEAGRGCD